MINPELFQGSWCIASLLTVQCTIIDGAMDGPLSCKGDCSAAAVRAADGRRTTGVTTAER